MRVAFVAGEADAGERIDLVVTRLTQLPRARVQEALRTGALHVGGIAVRASYRLSAGESVAGVVPDATPDEPAAESLPLLIRYEDERVLVVSKPAGMVTHPGAGQTTGTLVNALLGGGRSLSMLDPRRPGIVHRLDKDTSGLLLVAKDDDAHRSLAAALKDRSVERRYLALVRGEVGSRTGTVDAPIARHPARRRLMAVVAGGRAATTHFTALAALASFSLLEVRLETGRTHQIRVHLSHLGHPVLGDATYGGRGEAARALGLERPFLHAWKLAFPHPDDTRRVEVSDPPPPDLVAALERAGITLPPP